MPETFPDLPPLPDFSFLLFPGAACLALALLALAFPALHPVPAEKKTRLGGFTWWLLVALCLGGLGASAELWRTQGSAPVVYVFWSVICGVGAAGLWHSARAKGEKPASPPAGLRNLGRFLDGNGRFKSF